MDVKIIEKDCIKQNARFFDPGEWALICGVPCMRVAIDTGQADMLMFVDGNGYPEPVAANRDLAVLEVSRELELIHV